MPVCLALICSTAPETVSRDSSGSCRGQVRDVGTEGVDPTVEAGELVLDVATRALELVFKVALLVLEVANLSVIAALASKVHGCSQACCGSYATGVKDDRRKTTLNLSVCETCAGACRPTRVG